MDSSGASILDKYEYFLFDGDGVLWKQDKALEGAIQLIKKLNELKKQVFFVTNNSTRSRQAVYEHAINLGFKDTDDTQQELISIDQFYPSGYACALYCKKIIGSKKVFLIGKEGLQEEFTKVGIEVVKVPEEFKTNSRISEKEFSAMTVDPTIDTVVSGYFDDWTYKLMGYASLLIRGDGISNGCQYVGANIDSVHSTGTRNQPGGGSVMKMIGHSAGVEPVSGGKPSKIFFDLLTNDHDLADKPKEKFLMIGDGIDTDIAFGICSGIDTLLVLSGVTKEENLEKLLEKHKSYKPTYIMNSVQDVLN